MRRLHLYQLQKSVAQDGHMAWLTVTPIWVLLRPLRTRALVRQGEAQFVATHRAQLRHHAELQPGMRLLRDKRQFIILHAEPLGRRDGWLSCLCEEQKPFLGHAETD